MQYRKFGRTGWNVSEIGFGGWQLGGTFGPMDEDESVSMLHEAWDRGVNLVDTAQMYGKGRSEEIIGRALREWSGQPVYVATKVQPVKWPKADEDDPDIAGRYPAGHLRRQCEDSLRRLQTEAIDLYQLHGWFPRGVEDTEWYDTLMDLKREGKIRAIGVSIRDYRPEDGIAIARTGRIDAEQVVFNLFEQRPAERLLPACGEAGVAVLARVPFDESALVGNWTRETYDSWHETDMRRKYFKGERFIRTLEKVESIKEVVRSITSDTYSSLAEVALKYCLSDPHVSCVIPGMKNRFELEANVRVSELPPLPQELVEALEPFNWPRNYHNPLAEVDPS